MHHLLQQPGVGYIEIDLCELGLQVHPAGLSRKTTGVVSDDFLILKRLSKYVCHDAHPHVPLVSGLPHLARIYPDKLCSEILAGLKDSVKSSAKMLGEHLVSC